LTVFVVFYVGGVREAGGGEDFVLHYPYLLLILLYLLLQQRSLPIQFLPHRHSLHRIHYAFYEVFLFQGFE